MATNPTQSTQEPSEVSGYVSDYLNAMQGLLGTANELFRTISELYSVLWTRVKLPIELQRIDVTIHDKLKESMKEVEENFRRAAREAGAAEVVVPLLRGGALVFERVDVESIEVELREYEVENRYDEVVVILLRRYDTVIGEFPLAWHGSGEPSYRVSVERLLMTTLLISKNPWLSDALKKSIEALLSEYRRTLEDVLAFYNALRLIGAETAKQ